MNTMIATAFVEEVGVFASRVSDAFAGELSGAGRAWVVRAPGGLDVMGGIAEYTGAVTLTAPTAGAVLAVAARRQDQQIVVDVLDTSGNGHKARTAWPLATFYAAPDELADPAAFRGQVETFENTWARPTAVALYAMLCRKLAPHFGGGLTFVFHSTLTGSAELGADQAVQTAVVAAAAAALGIEIPPPRIAELCGSIRTRCDSAPGGVSSALCSLLGEPDSLAQVRCQPQEWMGTLRLPQGIAVIGIDSGYRHPTAQAKYVDARVAAFMGRAYVEQTLRALGAAETWGGYLARITVNDYVERLRDRIPTKIKGGAFLERFPDTGCPYARVNPDAVYKIRSRAEHHIYENDRVHQFVERISRLARTGQRTALIEAGELMYASHWSYGQRCGLGTVATDLLVTHLRQRGTADGIYGARVSGHGAGGMVVALMDDTAEARCVVREVVDAYQQESGNASAILTGSSPGVFVAGVRQIP